MEKRLSEIQGGSWWRYRRQPRSGISERIYDVTISAIEMFEGERCVTYVTNAGMTGFMAERNFLLYFAPL